MSAGFESVFASHPVAIGAVRWSPQRVTLIVKLTFVASESGDLVLAPWESQESPQLDRGSDGGEVRWPSDFAPHKPGCDVAVVGADVASRIDPARLRVGGLAVETPAGERLGARESFASDPTSDEVFELWTGGAVPASRFHAAPPHLRTTWLAPPFDVFYERGAVRLAARFTGPWPSLSVLDRAGRRLAYLAPPIDLVGIEASARRVTLVGRVVYDAVAAPLEVSTLVLEMPVHPSLAPSAQWHTPRIVLPAGALRDEEATHSVGGIAFEGTAAAVRTAEPTMSSYRATAPLPVMPFSGTTRGAPSSRTGAAPTDFAALRRPAAAPAWDADEGTVVSTASAAPPGAPRSPGVVEAPPVARYPAATAFTPQIATAPAPQIAAPSTPVARRDLVVDETVVRLAPRPEALLPFRESRDPEPPAERTEQRATKPTSGWTDDGSGTRAAVVMPARGLPFRSRATRGDSAQRAPTLGAAELAARLRALDARSGGGVPSDHATLAVELERWAARLDDASPTGPLAALLREGTTG